QISEDLVLDAFGIELSHREIAARASSSVPGAEGAASGVDGESRHDQHNDHQGGQPQPAEQSSIRGNDHECDPPWLGQPATTRPETLTRTRFAAGLNVRQRANRATSERLIP